MNKIHPAIRELPSPIPSFGPSCHDSLVDRLKRCNRIALVPSLIHRKQLGEERYGALLQPKNGRSASVDAFQEALDLSVYWEQKILETENPLERNLIKVFQNQVVSMAEWLLVQIEKEDAIARDLNQQDGCND